MEGECEDGRIPIEGEANQSEFPDGIHEVEQHPLLMPTVMSVLFQQMTSEELANCRQVCRDWFIGSLSIWRSTVTLNLSSGWGPKEEAELSVKNFHKFRQDEGNKCGVKPFARIRIFESGLQHNSEFDGYLCGQVGVNLSHLTMHGCQFASPDQFLEVVCRACPNLQNLTIISCDVLLGPVYGPEIEPYQEPKFGEHTQLKSLSVKNFYLASWLNLLSHFTSLDKITILDDEDETHAHEKILKAVKTIRTRDPNKLPLKHYGATLELDYDYAQDPIPISYGSDLLRQFRIPLAGIIINLGDDIDRDLVKSILKFHAETIKYMSFWNYEEGENHPFEFPSGVQFPSLRTLRIRYGIIFKNFHFLQSTPNITDLQINYEEKETARFQPHYLFSNSLDLQKSGLKLTRLRNLNVDFTVSGNNFRCLTWWFPNVEKIQMTLNVPQIKLAFKRWGHLSELAPHPFQPESEEVKEFRLATLQDKLRQE